MGIIDEKFRINCRPQFPTRTFQTASAYTINYYLPTSSYYAIKDLYTNEFVIDFDTNYTQISADSESSYFTLYMNGLEEIAASRCDLLDFFVHCLLVCDFSLDGRITCSMIG